MQKHTSVRQQDTQPKYITLIHTRDKWTDKPFAFLFIVSILVYFTAAGIYMKKFLSWQEAKAALENLFGDSVLKICCAGFILPTISTLLLTYIVLGIFYTIPVATIHTMFILNIFAFPILNALFFVMNTYSIVNSIIIACVVAFMYYKTYKNIKTCAPAISTVSHTLMSNSLSLLTYFSICFISLIPFIIVFLFSIHVSQIAQSTTTLVVCITALFILLLCDITLQYFGDVFYSRIIFASLRNKAMGASGSVAGSALKRSIMSIGTIYIASLLYFVVLLIRIGVDALAKQTNEREKGDIGKAILLILLMIVSIILHLLQVAVDVINNYVLVYSSLFGEGYKVSMHKSFETIKKDAKYRYILLFVGIVFSGFASIIFLIAMSMINMAYGNNEIMEILLNNLFGVLFFLFLALTSMQSLTSSFLSFQMIYALDKGLVHAVYPHLMLLE
ncbi:hypothetical protein NEFER03_1675 [Nematocida sp. LUAm3]|nr:hypothetical protein NEFER03_1675 [Nematocida sp. LUAm3]KAI5175665.1 hypothetical protein NEFER02_1552 [Nematocida sp. LUAm2]KAI5178571.1 hypothetical protein NEFER01_1707 [Nematocida sp. LUAm1]